MKHLSELETGARGLVSRLHGGREFAERMTVLGFTPGVKVHVIQNYGKGPIIVNVRETRVALGRGEAAKVVVKSVNQE